MELNRAPSHAASIRVAWSASMSGWCRVVGPRDHFESGLIGNRTPCVSFPPDRARFAGPMSSCWTMSPSCLSSPSGSRGTRTHKRAAPAACFQDRFLIRPDDFRGQVAGVGIEPGTEPLAWSLRVQSPASLPAATIPQWMSVEGHNSHGKVRELRGQESNLRTRGSKPRISTSRNYPAMGRGTGGTRTHARVLNKHRHAVAFYPPAAVCR